MSLIYNKSSKKVFFPPLFASEMNSASYPYLSKQKLNLKIVLLHSAEYGW